MNKKLPAIFYIFLLTLLAIFIISPAQADTGRTKFIDPSSVPSDNDEENLFFSLQAGFYSSYFFRGIELYRGTSFQPSTGLFYDFGDWGTLGGSVWMQVPMENDQQSLAFYDEDGNFIEANAIPKFYELDITASYDVSFDIVTLSTGHIWYTDPGYGQDTAFVNGEKVEIGEIAPDTGEFYAGLSLDLPGQPIFTFYHDYRELEYQYYSLGFSETLSCEPVLGEDFNITPFVNFGFASSAADDISVYNSNGLVHISTGVKFDVDWGIFRVTPSFTYHFGTDDDNEDGSDRTGNKFIFAVDIGYDHGFSL